MAFPSTLQIAQRRPVDGHRVAVVSQTAEQRLHHRPTAQKVRPLVISKFVVMMVECWR